MSKKELASSTCSEEPRSPQEDATGDDPRLPRLLETALRDQTTSKSKERRQVMSQHGTDHILQVGYLRSCMDRRFVEATRRKFEEVTRLTGDRYYHEAFAGGALNQVPTPPPNPNPDGADYVYNNPEILLEVMGWQAHLDHCGGLPGRDNVWIRTHFQALVNSGTLQNKYPRVRHVFLLAYEDSNHEPVVDIITPTGAKL